MNQVEDSKNFSCVSNTKNNHLNLKNFKEKSTINAENLAQTQ